MQRQDPLQVILERMSRPWSALGAATCCTIMTNG